MKNIFKKARKKFMSENRIVQFTVDQIIFYSSLNLIKNMFLGSELRQIWMEITVAVLPLNLCLICQEIGCLLWPNKYLASIEEF